MTPVDNVRYIVESAERPVVGPPATINCEPRQARKGATVAVDLCAGVRLAGRPL